MSIRVIIADEENLLLDGLEAIIEREADLDVVGRVVDEERVLDVLRQTRPDVLVLGRRLLTGDGLSLLRHMREQQITTPVVLIASSLTDAEMVQGLRLGVAGVLLKTMPARLLLQCIRKVHGGGEWMERESAGRALQRMLQQQGLDAQATALSLREIDVVRAVARGLRNRQVAEKLFISESTVKVHLSKIFDKLQVTSRMELSLYAQENGLV
jgi:DNA-binding NarL/FixJ family response regulator